MLAQPRHDPCAALRSDVQRQGAPQRGEPGQHLVAAEDAVKDVALGLVEQEEDLLETGAVRSLSNTSSATTPALSKCSRR
jgi:hypothetical protein